MKGIEQIAKEFQEIVKGNVYDDCSGWEFYNACSGYYNGLYYDVYFMKQFKEDCIIDVSENTKKRDVIIGIIKNIEPLIKIRPL